MAKRKEVTKTIETEAANVTVTIKDKSQEIRQDTPVLLAIDPGNGTTVVVGSWVDVPLMGRGEVSENQKPIAFPSVIKEIQRKDFGGVGFHGDQIDYRQVKLGANGKPLATKEQYEHITYAFGDYAAQVDGGIDQLDNTDDRTGSNYQKVLLLAATAKALHRLGYHKFYNKEEPVAVKVSWVLNLPPDQFDLKRKDMESMSGTYDIEYQGCPYRIQATVHKVYPEGFGVAYCYIIDSVDAGELNPKLAHRVGVIDGGFRTIDSAIFVYGKLDVQTAHSDFKAIRDVVGLLIDKIRDKFNINLSVPEAERIVRTRKFVNPVTKECIDFSPILSKVSENLGEFVETSIIGGRFDKGNRVDCVVLGGGMAYMIEEYLKNGKHKDLIFTRDSFANTANMDYTWMNALGHYAAAVTSDKNENQAE